MRTFKLRKRSGSYRTIYAPDKNEAAALRLLLPDLARHAAQGNSYGVQHGFQPRRSAVTNALQHRGYKYTLSFDLADFFDSVTWDKVKDALIKRATVGTWGRAKAMGFPDGAARQGLPTSPALANIAAEPIDADIVKLISNPPKPRRRFEGVKAIKRECVYTRYADDLTFSFDSVYWFDVLRQSVPEIVERHGFKVNPAKTSAQSAVAGRRIITGVSVDKQIKPPRFMRRRLRAALHQRHTSEARGLAEWCKLKTPKGWTGNVLPQTKLFTPVTAPTKPKATATATARAFIVPLLKRIIRLDP